MSATQCGTPAKDNKYSLTLLWVLAVVVFLGLVPHAEAQDIWTMGHEKGEAAREGLVTWLRIGGVISLIVCGLMWVATGRANMRWFAGACAGLFIGAAAGPIVDFFYD